MNFDSSDFLGRRVQLASVCSSSSAVWPGVTRPFWNHKVLQGAFNQLLIRYYWLLALLLGTNKKQYGHMGD
jgi:hypothetical protein